MFNEKQKSAFLITIAGESQRKIALATFELTEAYENSLNKDLCLFTTDQMTPIVNNIVSLGAGKNSTRMKVLRQYLRWCISKGIPGAADNLSSIGVELVEPFRRKMVSGPGHLQRCLDVYFDEESLETIDNIYRCYMWLLFSGVEPEDIITLTPYHINLPERIITVGESVYEIYKESVPCIKNCIELTSFMYHHPNYTDEYVSRQRMEGDLLLRGIKSMMDNTKFRISLSTKVSKLKDDNVPRLTTKSVYLSGIFYRQYEIDRSIGGLNVGHDQMSNVFYDVIVNQRHRGKMPEKTNKHEAWVMYCNYEKWKMAFAI